MELIIKQIAEESQVQVELIRELVDMELALVGGGMGAVVFDDD